MGVFRNEGSSPKATHKMNPKFIEKAMYVLENRRQLDNGRGQKSTTVKEQKAE